MSKPLTINDVIAGRFYVVPEVAALFRVTERTVRTWCSTGRFPKAKAIGRKWLIPGSDILAAVE